MSMRDAAIAANRFGLGARPGELRSIAADPRGWLLGQLVPELELPAPLQALPRTAEDQTAFFRWLRDYGRGARAGRAERVANTERAEPSSMSSTPVQTSVEQSYVKALLPVYVRAIEARMQTALGTAFPFRERLMRFWSNHFVVSAAKPAAITLPASFERDVARKHVVGRFIDMLLAAEKHPAMLLFLDNAQTIGPGSVWGRHPDRVPDNGVTGRPRGLNENLAREILELHTLGVNGGYTQADVTAFAHVITGWQIANPFRQLKLKRFANWTADDFFHFNPDAHEPGAKTVLGTLYDQTGAAQGEAVLHDLAAHPNTAALVAGKLARHFAADMPAQTLVDRLARAFRDSEGDLREVCRTLVNSPEPWAGDLTKFKPPEDYVLSVLRGLGGPNLTGIQQLTLLSEMGQRPYWSSGPDGWKDVESEWLGADALWKRLEWAELAGRAMARGTADPLALAEDLLGPLISASTRAAVAQADSAAQGLALLVASPEFMRR